MRSRAEDLQVERVLKRDTLGRVEVVRDHRGLAVRRVPSRLPIVGFVARLLRRREQRALRVLSGLAGFPQLIERAGQPPLRSWLPGQTLATASRLPRDYFALLEQLVVAMHARGVCHNDLHKEGNLIVADDGRPAVIDFQLASVHRRRGRAFSTRAAEDLRHVQKHRATYCRALGAARPDELLVPERSRSARAWRRWWKPLYHLLTRATRLRRARPSSEPRRRRDGPWPQWSTPVGPRHPSAE